MLYINHIHPDLAALGRAQSILADAQKQVWRLDLPASLRRLHDEPAVKLSHAIDYIGIRIAITPDFWWCSECETAGCSHAVEAAERNRAMYSADGLSGGPRDAA